MRYACSLRVRPLVRGTVVIAFSFFFSMQICRPYHWAYCLSPFLILPVAMAEVGEQQQTGDSPAAVVALSDIPRSNPGIQSAVEWVLQSARDNNSQGASRVLIGSGLPTIPKELLEKIQSWEFVDMTELLPAASTDESAWLTNSPRFSLFPGMEMTRPRRHQVSSIAQWVQCFAVYIAAVVAKHPSMVNELLAYMLTIIKASQQYDGLHWRAYDTHYRISAAASGNTRWSQLDTDLYTRFFMGRAKLIEICRLCDGTSHSTSDCPHLWKRLLLAQGASSSYVMKKKNSKSWPSEVCTEYNARGSCSFQERCKFRHMCGECTGKHPAKLCPSRSM